LVVDYSALKKRVRNKEKITVTKMSRPGFIEVDLSPPTASWACIIELEDGLGARMRMQFKNDTDYELVELVNAFWRKGS